MSLLSVTNKPITWSGQTPTMLKAPVWQRTAVALKPFLELHPIGRAAAVTGRSLLRAGRAVIDVRKEWQQGNFSGVTHGLMRSSVLIANIGVAIFEHSFLNLFAVSTALVKDLLGLAQALRAKDEQAIRDTTWALTGSALMLVSTLYAVPEMILISMMFGVVSELYKSFKHYQRGNWLEAAASLAMAAIFTHQAGQTAQEVKARLAVAHAKASAIFSGIFVPPKFKGLMGRIEKGLKVDFLKDHPLGDLSKVLKERGVVFENAQMGIVDLGAHTSYLGGDTVKGSVINLRERNIDGKEVYELAFNVNHVHRKKLDVVLGDYQGLPQEVLNEFVETVGVCEGDLGVSKGPYQYLRSLGGQYTAEGALEVGQAHTLTCKGVGSVSVGASTDVPSLYDRVVVRVNKQQAPSNMHFLLSLFGLDGALKPSTSDQIERLKIGHLFRSYYPKEALSIERKPSFFELSLEALKNNIIETVPQMQTIFTQELPNMQPVELLPGKIRYSIPDLDKKARDLGARALMSGLRSGADLVDRAASVLTTGALSSQGRFASGLFVNGVSSFIDHQFGGADSIFTRLVTDTTPTDLTRFAWSGDLQFIYSLKGLTRGSYQYHQDQFGDRRIHGDSYKTRPSILDFVQEQRNNSTYSNEVMLKDYVPPEEIVGCVVRDQSLKDKLIAALKSVGVAKEIGKAFFVRGVPIDDFIRIGPHIDSKMLARAVGF